MIERHAHSRVEYMIKVSYGRSVDGLSTGFCLRFIRFREKNNWVQMCLIRFFCNLGVNGIIMVGIRRLNWASLILRLLKSDDTGRHQPTHVTSIFIGSKNKKKIGEHENRISVVPHIR